MPNVRSPLETRGQSQTERYPLLMDLPSSSSTSTHEHITIDVPIDISPSNYNSNNTNNHVATSSNSDDSASSTGSSTEPNSRNNSFTRRGESPNPSPNPNPRRRQRSPLNSGLWILIELVINLCQIVASIMVLSVSKNEHPRTPLVEWIIGYTIGCVLYLPHLYWRYSHGNSQGNEQETGQLPHQQNGLTELNYSVVSTANTFERENGRRNWRNRSLNASPRMQSLVEHFKMGLDCFFAVWFVVGNVWVFGGRSSASDAPNLYRLCIVYITLSCIGYALPFVLCAMVCFCLPCIISFMGYTEDLGRNRGANQETIDSLPTYKFKLKRLNNNINSNNSGEICSDGGILAVGTDQERIISAEDAECCICLAKYADNDELRELPCTHYFHKECVDKWLKINALCPLCKSEVPDSSVHSSLGFSFGRRHTDRRVRNGIESQD